MTDHKTLFLCVDQINVGLQFVESDSLIKVAKLNFEAAKRAAELNAFASSAHYTEAALSSLDPATRWKDHYELTLQLLTLSAEMNFCCKKYDSIQ